MGRCFKKFGEWTALAVGILIVLMMLHVTAEVFARLLFGLHIAGTMEFVTYYYMVAAVFMGIFVCNLEDGHIRVDVLAQFLKGKIRRFVDVVGWVVMLVYFLIFSYGLYVQALRSWTRNETVDAVFLELPIWPSRWIAVAGLVLTALSVVYLFRKVSPGSEGEHQGAGQ